MKYWILGLFLAVAGFTLGCFMKSAQEMAEEYANPSGDPGAAKSFNVMNRTVGFLAGYAAAEPRVLALKAEVKALEERIKDLANLLVQEA